MREHLQPWYDRWLDEHEGTGLIYANAGGKVMLSQAQFVRDELASVVWAGVPYEARAKALPRENCRETAFVIGEHTSKSVRLPVYAFERPDMGLRLILRNNFHDWNVSVISENDVKADLHGFHLDYLYEREKEKFKDGFVQGRSWGYCFFQGFPEDVQFGPYVESRRRFSIALGSNYDLYTFVWLVMRDLRGR